MAKENSYICEKKEMSIQNLIQNLIQKEDKYKSLKTKINHVFNRNVDFIFDAIWEESITLPLENSAYVEKEMTFEIETRLAMTEMTDDTLRDSVLKDYKFFLIESRRTDIINLIIDFRGKRAGLVKNAVARVFFLIVFFATNLSADKGRFVAKENSYICEKIKYEL